MMSLRLESNNAGIIKMNMDNLEHCDSHYGFFVIGSLLNITLMDVMFRVPQSKGFPFLIIFAVV